MPPSHLAPSAKPLSGRYLSFAEREEIAIWRAQRHGVREIARRLARAPSTISRELRRNAATRSGGLAYRATTAQWHADRSARRPKSAKLAINEPLRRYVQDRLADVIIAPNGAAVRGPVVPWKGRRHGRRQDRRWATAWSPDQYVSIRYTERLAAAGIEPSVGSVGDSFDNALAETINGLYKAEVIHRRGPWRSFEAVEFATLEWVDWFNHRRLLEPIGNLPPAEAEARYYAQREVPARAA